MKAQLREDIWKKLGSYGGIPKIKKIERAIKLLKRTVGKKSVHITDTVPPKVASKFESVSLDEADLIVTGAVAVSDSGACIGLKKENYGRKKVIAIVDSTQVVKTKEYDFTVDTIITPHYIIDSKRVMGIDEAGRGCVIGPLVVGAACVKECELSLIKKMGARDSKTLTPKKREFLDKEIRKVADVYLARITPAKIDGRNGSRKNLNRLEEEAFLSLIKKSGAKIVFTDALGSDCKKFSNKLEMNLDPSYNVTSAIKGDAKYPIVGAASIVAKVARDASIERLHTKYGDFGSGYSHDAKTNAFLAKFYKENKFFPPMVRRNWGTVERIKGEVTQKKLGELF